MQAFSGAFWWIKPWGGAEGFLHGDFLLSASSRSLARSVPGMNLLLLLLLGMSLLLLLGMNLLLLPPMSLLLQLGLYSYAAAAAAAVANLLLLLLASFASAAAATLLLLRLFFAAAGRVFLFKKAAVIFCCLLAVGGCRSGSRSPAVLSGKASFSRYKQEKEATKVSPPTFHDHVLGRKAPLEDIPNALVAARSCRALSIFSRGPHFSLPVTSVLLVLGST